MEVLDEKTSTRIEVYCPTRPIGRMIKRPCQPARPLAGAVLASAIKTIIREVAAEPDREMR